MRWSGRARSFLCPAWWVSHVERIGSIRDFAAFSRASRMAFASCATTVRARLKRPRRSAANAGSRSATACDARRYAGDAQFSIFAVSCAGPVALSYAARHQARLRRLCFYGSYANGADSPLRKCGMPWRSGEGALGLGVRRADGDFAAAHRRRNRRPSRETSSRGRTDRRPRSCCV